MTADRNDGVGAQVIDLTDRLHKDVRSKQVVALQGSGGDGTSGGMESRLARLESDMEHVKKAVDKLDRGQEDIRKSLDGLKSDFSGLKVDFGRFDERSKHFPSKGFIFSVSAGLLAATSAVMAILIRLLH